MQCIGGSPGHHFSKKQTFVMFLPIKQRIYDYFYEFASEALHIVIFENCVKSMTSCLSKLKVTPSFGFAFKIPDNVTATSSYPWRSESMTNFPFFYVASQHIILTPLYTCHCSISLSLFTKVNKLGFFLASQASDPKSQIMKIHESTRFSISFRPAFECK